MHQYLFDVKEMPRYRNNVSLFITYLSRHVSILIHYLQQYIFYVFDIALYMHADYEKIL